MARVTRQRLSWLQWCRPVQSAARGGRPPSPPPLPPSLSEADTVKPEPIRSWMFFNTRVQTPSPKLCDGSTLLGKTVDGGSNCDWSSELKARHAKHTRDSMIYRCGVPVYSAVCLSVCLSVCRWGTRRATKGTSRRWVVSFRRLTTTRWQLSRGY